MKSNNLDLTLDTILRQLQRLVEVAVNGVLVGVKRRLNFIAGNNVTLNVVDNPTKNSVDITINSSGGSGGLSDGDYGDVTVSGSGTVINIDADVVGNTELRNSSGNSVIGRAAASSGDPADIVASTPDLPLRLNSGVLDFGTIPQSSVINLVTDLGNKVPTSRAINTTSPITGGGNLSADRTLGFDSGANLDNNARVKVDKNGTGVGIRREINFIEGAGVSLTVIDDSGSEKVDVTITSSGSGMSHQQVVSRALLLS